MSERIGVDAEEERNFAYYQSAQHRKRRTTICSSLLCCSKEARCLGHAAHNQRMDGWWQQQLVLIWEHLIMLQQAFSVDTAQHSRWGMMEMEFLNNAG